MDKIENIKQKITIVQSTIKDLKVKLNICWDELEELEEILDFEEKKKERYRRGIV